jgi:hypothetical protein
MNRVLKGAISLAGVSLCAALFGGVAGIGGISPAGHEFAGVYHNLQSATDPMPQIGQLAQSSGMELVSAQG